MGAPLGNQNGTKQNRWWAETLKRALLQEDGKKLRALAEKLIARAEEGDIAALKEIGDRVDGRPQQAIVGGSDEDGPPIRLVIGG
jgi:ribosomal protein S6E (S10)